MENNKDLSQHCAFLFLDMHGMLLFCNIRWNAGRGEKDMFGLEEGMHNGII